MDIWRKWRNPRQKPPFGARIDWSDPITEGLVGCWLFNELVGRKCYNLVDGLETNFYNNACFRGNGVYFDGYDDYLVSATEAPVEPPFSVSCKCYCEDYGGASSVIVGASLVKLYGWGLKCEQYNNTECVGFTKYGVVDLTSSIPSPWGRVSSISSVVTSAGIEFFVDSLYDYVSDTRDIKVPSDKRFGFGLYVGSAGEDFKGTLFHVFLWERALTSSEVERLHYEPYSFFVVPAARIFDLAPSGFTTTQDITWRLFTSKEDQIVYNILTDKQASFGYKIFDRKENSITYRIFTQDGSSFTWKIFASSNQDISYKIFTRLQSDLSWAIASTALSQAITYKILTRNEVNLSWLILTTEAASLDWSIFTTKEQQAIWNILAQAETDLLWDIYTRKDNTLAYKIFKDLNQDLIYKIFNSTEQDLVWKILAAGILSEILSWKIFAKQEDDLSWKILATEQQEFFYKIFNVKEDEITWLIKREDAADLSWKLLNLKEDSILWKIYSQAEKTIAWSILAALTSQDISYKIFTVKDEELFYNILAEASKSLDWKIYTFDEQNLSWQIITDTIPEPLALFKAKRRTLVFSPTRRIIVFKA